MKKMKIKNKFLEEHEKLRKKNEKMLPGKS